MDTLNVSGLKRDPDAIKKAFKKIGSSMVVTKDMRVIFPERYTNIDLAIIGSTVRLTSIYAILDDEGNYAVSNIPIFIELTPSNITDIEINGKVNKVLHFEEGTTFTENVNMVIDNTFLYDLFNEFYINGNIPWFISYNDAITIFEKTKKYAKSGLGDNPITMEILASILARNPKNKSEFYREILKNENDLNKVIPQYIGLMNIYFTFDNTVSKLVGSYYGQGISSAIISRETSTTTIEEILRA